jgi:hypothetical protein
MIKRAMRANNPVVTATMKRASAAAALLIAGRPGRELVAPEPLVQVGFEPDENEMNILVARAKDWGRDLIHVSCHADGIGGPLGMIATVYFENGNARAHRRCFLLSPPGSSEVLLCGWSDVEDEQCYFVLKPGEKMVRVVGPVTDGVEGFDAGLNKAGERWIALSKSPQLLDCDGERMWVHNMTQYDVGPSETEAELTRQHLHRDPPQGPIPSTNPSTANYGQTATGARRLTKGAVAKGRRRKTMISPRTESISPYLAAAALNILMEVPDKLRLDREPTGAPSVMFCAGPYASAECHAHMAEQAATNDQDIVLLEFDPAIHPILPATITVFQHVGSEIEVYRDCQLWVRQDQSLKLLVPAGQDVGFAVHRSRLIGVEGVPVDDEPGFELGRVRLFHGIQLLGEDSALQMRTLSRTEIKRKRRH